MGLTRPQALPWAAKNPTLNRPFWAGSERLHLSNPVPSWTVVVQQTVKEVQAAGVQPEAGSSPSIITDPVDRRGSIRPMY